jgi:hypothetical protein
MAFERFWRRFGGLNWNLGAWTPRRRHLWTKIPSWPFVRVLLGPAVAMTYWRPMIYLRYGHCSVDKLVNDGGGVIRIQVVLADFPDYVAVRMEIGLQPPIALTLMDRLECRNQETGHGMKHSRHPAFSKGHHSSARATDREAVHWPK